MTLHGWLHPGGRSDDDNNMFDDSGFFDEDGDDLLDFDSIASDIREE